MCRIYEKTYTLPDGTKEYVETATICPRGKEGSPCRSAERIPLRLAHHRTPGLVEDEGVSGPPSPAYPPTPESGNVDASGPSHGRQLSWDKRRADASKVRSPLRQETQTVQSFSRGNTPKEPRSKASSSERSSDTSAPPSYSSLSVRPTEDDLTIRPTRESYKRPKERRTRLKPIVTGEVHPNPPPGSSSGASSPSSAYRSATEKQDPKIDRVERHRAKEATESEARHHRRRQERGESSRHKSSRKEYPVDTVATRLHTDEEQARKENERLFYRDELRRRKREDDLQDKYVREAAGTRGEMRNQEDRSAKAESSSSGSRLRTQAFEHLTEQINESLNFSNNSSSEQLDEAEATRRRDVLNDQIRKSRSANERPWSRDSSAEAGQRADTAYSKAPQWAEESGQRRRTQEDASWQDNRRYEQGKQYYYDHRHENEMATEQFGSSGRAGMRRTNSQRNAPPASNPFSPRSPLHHRRQSYSDPAGPTAPAAQTDTLRPGSSSNNPAWVLDAEARRHRGQQVLQESRARAEARERLELLEREAQARQAQRRSEDDEWDLARPYPSNYTTRYPGDRYDGYQR